MQGDAENTGAATGAAPEAAESTGSETPTANGAAAAGSTDTSADAAVGATPNAEAGASAAPVANSPAAPEGTSEGTAAAAAASGDPAKVEEPEVVEEKPSYAHTGTTVAVEIVPENGHGFEHAFVTGDEPLLDVLDRAMKAKENVDLKLLAQTGKVQVAVNGEFVDATKSSVELGIEPGAKIDILTEG